MLTLTRLTIEGFRGFRETKEFSFDKPLTVFFGGNASCKSSTTNAIEWALFGGECAGKQTGIRERVGWIIPNQHLSVPGVRVQLEMVGPHGAYVVV